LTLQVGGDGFARRAQRRSARRPRTRCPGDTCIQPGHIWLSGLYMAVWLPPRWARPPPPSSPSTPLPRSSRCCCERTRPLWSSSADVAVDLEARHKVGFISSLDLDVDLAPRQPSLASKVVSTVSFSRRVLLQQSVRLSVLHTTRTRITNFPAYVLAIACSQDRSAPISVLRCGRSARRCLQRAARAQPRSGGQSTRRTSQRESSSSSPHR